MQSTSNDWDAITRSIQDTIAAFNARESVEVANAYVAESDLVTTKGERLQGPVEIEERLDELFSRPDFALQQRLVDLTVRFIRDDVALAHVMIEMNGDISSGRRPHAPHRELSLRVYVREGGTWRITAFHNTIVATS